MKGIEKFRCDHCKKWQRHGEMVTLPEELYPILNMDNEFGVCWECVNTYDLDYWKKWIFKARERREKSLKV